MTIVGGPGVGRPMRPFDVKNNKNGVTSPPLYLPSIYRYSCQGIFRVSTDTPGSVGTCRGLRSSLEHVLDFDVASRRDAIHQFTTQEEEVAAAAASRTDATGAGGGGNHPEAVKMLEEKDHANPALIYPPKKLKKPNNNQLPIIASDPETKRKLQDAAAAATTTTDELLEDDDEYSSRILHESWSAYGSTEVECLQLTSLKDGSTQIVAVAPYNRALVSYRNMDLVEGSSVTSVQIGFRRKLMFLLESTSKRHTQTNNDDPDQQRQKDGTRKAYETEHSVVQDLNDLTSELPGAPQPAAVQHWSDAASQALSRAKLFSEKTFQQSIKVTNAMKNNGVWLMDQFRQDFIHRTMESGKRTIHYMPTMAGAITKTIKELVGYGGGDDDGKDGDGKGSGF